MGNVSVGGLNIVHASGDHTGPAPLTVYNAMLMKHNYEYAIISLTVYYWCASTLSLTHVGTDLLGLPADQICTSDRASIRTSLGKLNAVTNNKLLWV